MSELRPSREFYVMASTALVVWAVACLVGGALGLWAIWLLLGGA